MPKKGNKAHVPPPSPAVISQQEAFWNTLYGDDLLLAKSTNCSCQEDLDREKKALEERTRKAEANKQRQLEENERKRQWEKQQEKQQREKNREEHKWKKQLEEAKKKAKSEGVLQAVYYEDGKWWVEYPDKTWREVQGEFYCDLCMKHLNDSTLEAHIQSEAHKKKVAWAIPGAAHTAAPPSPAVAPAAAPPRAVQPASVMGAPSFPVAMEAWQMMGPDGMVRCVPCNKVVDDNHLCSGDHLRRLEAWLQHEKLKVTGYAAPALEYLAYVPSDSGDPNSERWLRCLLCQKFVNDDTSHSGTQQNPAGSKEHQKNLRNYVGSAWYQLNVIEVRKKYHPEPTVRSAPAAQMPAGPTSVARQPPTAAPWAQAARVAPTPAPWAQTPPPSPWETAVVPVAPAPAPAPAAHWLANTPTPQDDAWGTYEVPNQATPYPAALEMGQESGGVAVIEEVDC